LSTLVQLTMEAADSNPPAEDIKMEGGDALEPEVNAAAAKESTQESAAVVENSEPASAASDPTSEPTTMATEASSELPIKEETKQVDEPMDEDIAPAVPEASTIAADATSAAASESSLPPADQITSETLNDIKPTVPSTEAASPVEEPTPKTNGTSRIQDVEQGIEAIQEAQAPTKVEELTPVAPKIEIVPTSTTKKPKIDTSSLPTRQYLDQTVVPILLQGLSWLAKTRPEDPISKLSTYLLEHKQEYENGHSQVSGTLDSSLLGGAASSSVI